MWPFSRTGSNLKSSAPILFTNTLSGKKEVFAPLREGEVRMYSCGPTVYSRAHIGNMRSYVFADLIARILSQAGYRVRRVMNMTDVGHLTGDNIGDADTGEDRMELEAARKGLRAADIASKYAKLAIEDMAQLGIHTDDLLFPRATDYLKEQIVLISELERKGLTYETPDGIYFDTAAFPVYGKLGGLPKDLIKDGSAGSLNERVALAAHARITENLGKRHPADFALWKRSPKGARRQQEWDSPWGRGFPGWHIECSAMSKALLGETIDIHTGGMDLIPIHHNNEIAQSEAANDRPFVRYWMHSAFLTIHAEKISKSLGNTIDVSEIVERGIHPLALRYLFLQSDFRKPLSFSWEALGASMEALGRLWRQAREIKELARAAASSSEERDRIIALLRDDLGTPQALALLWEVIKDEAILPKAAWGVICAADEVLGLSLTNPPALSHTLPIADLPEDIRALVSAREAARLARNFAKADEIRAELTSRGYTVDDTPSGPLLTKSHQ